MTVEARYRKVLFPNYPEENGWRYSRTAVSGKTGEKKVFIFYFLLFALATERDGICAFTSERVNKLIKISTRDDRPLIPT